MSWRLRIRPEAEADLAEELLWYERERLGLGEEFVAAIEMVLEGIRENPLQFPCFHREARRALAPRFPYAVFFIAEHEAATVLAIRHQARDPERWRIRV